MKNYKKTDFCGLSAICLLVLLLPACGGRSGLFSSSGPGGRDGGIDGLSFLDLSGVDRQGSWETRRPDRGRPDAARKDQMPRDSCLPIPAKQVEGTYAGTFSGTLTCQGFGSPISGTVEFTLAASGSTTTFKVQGKMKGNATALFTFTSSIAGTMGCTNLTASLPDLQVSTLVPPTTYQGTGTMQGSFNTKPQGFPAGSWQASEKGGTCKGSGSWFAVLK